MQEEQDSPEHHRQRSEFIRKLVQRTPGNHAAKERFVQSTPRTIVQYWHDLRQLPPDIGECVASWRTWESSGFNHRIFDEKDARAFISTSLGLRHEEAFDRCYHPAMQSDYFRLCYLLIEGGFYVDADDVCIGKEINWLFEDGRLKVQPLCYDIESGLMVEPSIFLRDGAYDPNWIFYFNNNPLIAGRGHPIIQHALDRATNLLKLSDLDPLPEIQSTTGPGLLTKSIFHLQSLPEDTVENDLVVLRVWNSFATSRWPLVHRDDARNWRYSNQIRFDPKK